MIALSHPDVGERFFHFEGGATPLFTENETNAERLFGTPNPTPYVKDAFHDYLVHGRKHAVNPDEKGTKAAVHHSLTIPAGQSRTLRFRLREPAPGKDVAPFEDFDAVLQARRGEADEFYASVIPPSLSADARNDTRKFQEDPHWRDLVLFYEYFHGDNGSGIGASHQTGWTGLVARGMHLFATTTPAQVLALGKAAGVTEVTTRPGGRGAGRPRQ